MNIPQIGKKFSNGLLFFVWVDRDFGGGVRVISPFYSKIAYCQAFLDGWKACKAEELRGLAQEERSHNEALEDALGPHGQG